MGLLQSFKDLAKSAAEHEADEIRAATSARVSMTEPLHDRACAESSGR